MKFILALVLTLPAFAGGMAYAAGASATINVVSRTGHPDYVVYAAVEPVQTFVLRAATTGMLTHFNVKPGDQVRRGERLARLAGPTYVAALVSARAAVTAARKAGALAHDRLRATQARYPLLSDRAALDQAKLAVVQAEVDIARMQAHLAMLSANGTIAVPTAGTVAAVLRGDGERVAAGEAILRIQPNGALWLRGSVYGKTVTAVQVGMLGVFHPAGGGQSIPVRVASRIPGAVTDGLGMGLVPVPVPVHPRWFSGESGLVTLEGPDVNEPVVPSSALILDHGHWWVIEVLKNNFKAVRVRPDFSRDGRTWIASGLKPGVKIVATDTYLIFHRAFAEQYGGED